MKYTTMIRIVSHHAMPVSEFLERHEMVKRLAGDESPVEWFVAQFLPQAEAGETYEDWIVRQVGDIAATAFRHDTMDGANGHVCRSVFNVAFCNEDREDLARTLGMHPMVRGLWDSIQMPEPLAG